MATIDPFKARISKHLEEVAQNDKLFAVTLKKPNKSIDGCINYIESEVRKTGRRSFLDDEIFKMAIHYYDEDDIKEIKSSYIRPQVTYVPEVPKPKVEEVKKPIPPIVPASKSKKKEKVQQIQLGFSFD